MKERERERTQEIPNDQSKFEAMFQKGISFVRKFKFLNDCCCYCILFFNNKIH